MSFISHLLTANPRNPLIAGQYLDDNGEIQTTLNVQKMKKIIESAICKRIGTLNKNILFISINSDFYFHPNFEMNYAGETPWNVYGSIYIQFNLKGRVTGKNAYPSHKIPYVLKPKHNIFVVTLAMWNELFDTYSSDPPLFREPGKKIRPTELEPTPIQLGGQGNLIEFTLPKEPMIVFECNEPTYLSVLDD